MENELAQFGNDIVKNSIEGISKYTLEENKRKAANAVTLGTVGAVIGFGLLALFSLVSDSSNK